MVKALMGELHRWQNPRYFLRAPLGTGSMGAVYRAYDRLTGQEVALKQVLLAPDYQPDQVESELLALAKEFRTLAGLRHPHIISVIDYGFDASRRPFYTMELLYGAQTILDAGRDRSIDDQVGLLVQALEALAYLHRRDILHHDLKPANMLVLDGQLRLPDEEVANEQQALAIARELGDRDAEARILTNHSVTLSHQHKIDEALHHAQQAARIAKDIGNIRIVLIAQDNEAGYHMLKEHYEKAWPLIEENLLLVNGRGFGDLSVHLMVTAAEWYAKQKQYLRALEYLADAEQLRATLEHVMPHRILTLSVEIYEAIGDSAQAALCKEKLLLLNQ